MQFFRFQMQIERFVLKVFKDEHYDKLKTSRSAQDLLRVIISVISNGCSLHMANLNGRRSRKPRVHRPWLARALLDTIFEEFDDGATDSD